MNLILFDDHSRDNLLPLTFTRPVADLRVGILTIAGKWELRLGTSPSFLTADYLSGAFPLVSGKENLFINGSLLPTADLQERILKLESGDALKKEDVLLAVKLSDDCTGDFLVDHWLDGAREYSGKTSLVDYPWKIFSLNGQEIESDFELLTRGRASEKLNNTVNVLNPEQVFVEPGFKGDYFTLNASSGPIYLSKDSEIMEGSVIRGPFSLGEHSTLKLGAKIYGPTTIGPYCKAGGEINNSVIHSYSNKGHDGFLGNSVIGQWCNIGADSNNSNLKNNYSEVKIWNYPRHGFVRTGLQFCGLIMGDHSKCAINTMFNTGTVSGVSANIFGSGFPRNFIPSFSWGGSQSMETYSMRKVLETVNLVLERRDIPLSATTESILQHIFDATARYRTWE